MISYYCYTSCTSYIAGAKKVCAMLFGVSICANDVHKAITNCQPPQHGDDIKLLRDIRNLSY